MENKSTDKKLIIGIILMLAGSLLLLETFEVTNFPIRNYIFNWKTLLIGIGAVIIATKERAVSGYVLIGLGIIFWLPSFINYSISLGQVFLPALLIAIGVIIITRRGEKMKRNTYHTKESEPYSNKPNNDYIDDISILGGGTKVVQSKNFKGGSITAIFGGSDFSLKDVEVSDEGGEIDLFTVFGGSKLIMADNWVVKSDMFSIFGGFNDKRTIKPEKADHKNILYLKGAVIFGGIEIKSF